MVSKHIVNHFYPNTAATGTNTGRPYSNSNSNNNMLSAHQNTPPSPAATNASSSSNLATPLSPTAAYHTNRSSEFFPNDLLDTNNNNNNNNNNFSSNVQSYYVDINKNNDSSLVLDDTEMNVNSNSRENPYLNHQNSQFDTSLDNGDFNEINDPNNSSFVSLASV
jgi:hypothetical protein